MRSLSDLVEVRTRTVPSTQVAPALVVAAVAEVALKVVALVVLVRTPRGRVRMGVRWPWALVILLVNTIGSVVFLAVGRRPAAPDDVLAVGRDEPGGDDMP